MKTFIKSNNFWILIAFICAFSVFVAHVIFQHLLFMLPCERCVYIRYAFFVVFLGAVLALILPRFLKFLAYLFIFYGTIYGILASYDLIKIKNSIISGDVFGLSGCKMTPDFHFNLPLHEWWSDMFEPKALCGFDAPEVPADANLTTFQGFFVEFYSGGWYLVPKYELLSLAHCSIILFTAILAFVILRIIGKLFWK